jgi:hypothetical protein
MMRKWWKTMIEWIDSIHSISRWRIWSRVWRKREAIQLSPLKMKLCQLAPPGGSKRYLKRPLLLSKSKIPWTTTQRITYCIPLARSSLRSSNFFFLTHRSISIRKILKNNNSMMCVVDNTWAVAIIWCQSLLVHSHKLRQDIIMEKDTSITQNDCITS